MARIVQKFGGTSVADIGRLERVALKVKREIDAGHQVAVVVSAMAGVTNQLVNYAISLAGHIHDKRQSAEYDVVIASGEQITSGLLALALFQIGIPARSLLSWQIPIVTCGTHANAHILKIDSQSLEACWTAGIVPVIAGFQGLTPEGRLSTLGRGGSDTTAVALAAALKAERCDIYTDVAGVYTADPRIVPSAQKLKEISYEEMVELSAQGAKVLQKRSVETAQNHQVRVRVLSSFNDEPGTEMVPEKLLGDSVHISGITHRGDEARLTLKNIQQDDEAIPELFKVLETAEIHLEKVVQNIAEDDQVDITFTVLKGEIPRVVQALQEAKTLTFADLILDTNVAKITVVGVGLRQGLGLATKMFQTLKEESIPSQVISCSPIKVSVLVDEPMVEKALRCLHSAYGLDKECFEGVES